jgi:PTS system ascorbate-specific IIA component
MIGIVIVAHGKLGESLIDCARHVLGREPERLLALSAGHDEERETALAALQKMIAAVDAGDGVLLLTDLFGATPANLAGAALQSGRVAGIAGVSLPMLLRAINYRQLPLAELQAKALAAATECVAALNA